MSLTSKGDYNDAELFVAFQNNDAELFNALPKKKENKPKNHTKYGSPQTEIQKCFIKIQIPQSKKNQSNKNKYSAWGSNNKKYED
jgi:hypothetical protein